MMIQDLEHRFAYHAPKTEEKKLDHALVRQRCLELAMFINEKVPQGREQSTAFTKLEEVMMWANAGIARAMD
jgi:hypothetical protein